MKRRVVPISGYRLGPLAEDSAFFTPPVGQIGVHRPREIVRVERDYTGGEVVQFSSAYPTELEGRVSVFPSSPSEGFFFFFAEGEIGQITPRQFMESINAINEILISAYSLWHSVLDNCVEIFSLQLSRLVISTHYDRVRLLDTLSVPTQLTGWPRPGDEAITATHGWAESRTIQSCRSKHSLAEKARVHICKLTVSHFRQKSVLKTVDCIKLEIEYYVSWRLRLIEALVWDR